MWFATTAALACGGLFCSPPPTDPRPVVQNGERIAFSIADGFVEAHVQVFYEGPPDAFAWVVPVPADVEVFPSNEQLFTVLDQSLGVRFPLEFRTEGDCVPNQGCRRTFEDTDAPLDSVPGRPPSPATPVTVTDAGTVGPYDYLVLSGTSEDALVDFLHAEGFDFDSTMSDALMPYVSSGSHFLAVRLQKDASTGDISPLGFRYAGDEATIPIQLTRVAAAPEMGVQVHVFGGQRAVSTNYLHAIIDPAKIDWFDGGRNYYDLVSQAADEAGGHAFVVEAALGTQGLQSLWTIDQERAAADLDSIEDIDDFALALNRLNLPLNSVLEYGLQGFIDESGAILPDADLPALASQLDVRVFDGLRRAQDLMDLPWVTRMVTQISPAEMTLDPRFALNDLLPQKSPTQVATQLTVCRDKGRNNTTYLVMEDGRHLDVSDDPMNRTSEVAIRIEDWSAGQPQVLLDLGTEAFDAADSKVTTSDCGCRGTPWAPGVLMMLAPLIGLRRRP